MEDNNTTNPITHSHINRTVEKTPFSHASEECPDTLGIAHNLISAQLALAEYTVYERDWHLTHGVPQRTCTNHHLHLEHVPARLGERDNVP
jgi:hypothetical protein